MQYFASETVAELQMEHIWEVQKHWPIKVRIKIYFIWEVNVKTNISFSLTHSCS